MGGMLFGYGGVIVGGIARCSIGGRYASSLDILGAGVATAGL